MTVYELIEDIADSTIDHNTDFSILNSIEEPITEMSPTSLTVLEEWDGSL